MAEKSENRSKFLRYAKAGLPLKDELVIDSHTHIGSYYYDYYIPNNNSKSFIEHMDRLGINKICAFSYAGVHSDFKYGNDEVAEMATEYSDRIIGYVFLNLHYPDEWIPELERCHKIGLTRGIKLYGKGQGRTTKEAKMTPVYQYADDNRMIIINHSWGSKEFLDELAGNYPNICFIVGHGLLENVLELAGILRRRKNVYLSTTVAYWFGALENCLKHVSSRKLLFGSDLGYTDGAAELAAICYGKISDEAKRRILGLNMREILDKYC